MIRRFAVLLAAAALTGACTSHVVDVVPASTEAPVAVAAVAGPSIEVNGNTIRFAEGDLVTEVRAQQRRVEADLTDAGMATLQTRLADAVAASPPLPTAAPVPVHRLLRAEPVIGSYVASIGVDPCVGWERYELGIRGCNPGNLGHLSTGEWTGEVDCDLVAGVHKTRFACFKSPAYGLRALVLNSRAFHTRHSIDTLLEFFERWAPSSDGNAPAAYAAAVARSLAGDGYPVAVDEDLSRYFDLDRGFYRSLAKAITLHENGEQPYSDETVNAGVELAFG